MLKVNEIIEALKKGRLINRGTTDSVRGISIDSRSIKSGYAFLAIRGNNFDGHGFIFEAIKKGASCIIQEAKNKKGLNEKSRVSKNITVIEADDTVRALGELARFWRRKLNVPVIAVAGSNGKTTTKEMLAEVLSEGYKVLKNEGTKNNCIGLPLTLLELDKSHDLAVLEIGTNHFGEVRQLAKICEPNIGIITNIGPAHLEHFLSLGGVFREKSALIKNLSCPGIAVLNSDDNFFKKNILQKTRLPFTVSFGIDNRADFKAQEIVLSNKKTDFTVNKKYKFTIETPGYYNIYNALAAIAVGRIFGLDYPKISSALSRFEFPKGRLKIKRVRQTVLIDDTYNSNPLSLSQALLVLGNFKTRGRKILVIGDMMELGKDKERFHAEVGPKLLGLCDVLIATGKLSGLCAREALKAGFSRENIYTCSDSIEARSILLKKVGLRKSDVVLIKGSRVMKMEEVLKV